MSSNIIFNDLDKIADALPEEARKLVEETAAGVVTDAQRRVPVRTGELRESIDYEMESNRSAVVRVKQFYGRFHEFGTVNMAARPFLTPAVEAAKSKFFAEVGMLFGRARR